MFDDAEVFSENIYLAKAGKGEATSNNNPT